MPLRPALLALCLAFAACASTGPRMVTDADNPHAVGTGSAVNVRWGDPNEFAELRYSQNRRIAVQGDWVVELAEYMQKQVAKAVPAGERVDVEILDLQRAGQFEWMRTQNDDVRVMRDVYPPRMTLQFKRTASDGSVISEGARQISDLAYLQGPSPFPSSDPLRYDKRMIDTWIRREFK